MDDHDAGAGGLEKLSAGDVGIHVNGLQVTRRWEDLPAPSAAREIRQSAIHTFLHCYRLALSANVQS